EFHFAGNTGHWALNLALAGGNRGIQSHTATLDCDPVFKLYGLGPADAVTLRVRVAAKVDVVEDGFDGLGNFRGRVAIHTPTARDSLDLVHEFSGTPTTTTETLEVPVVVHGDTQLLTFHLDMLTHLEMFDNNHSHRQNIDADVSFL